MASVKKENLVFIPGFGTDEAIWQHQATHLQEEYSVHFAVMDRQLSRQEMVDHVLNTAPPTFHLAGQSMGGWVAQAVAAHAPHRVQKLLLLNTWCTADAKVNELQHQLLVALKEEKLEALLPHYLFLLLYPPRLKENALVDSLKQMLMRFSKEVLIHQLHAMMTDGDSLPLLSKITSKTLLIHGREDALFPIEQQKQFLTHIKHSQLAIIEECGHCLTVERPQAVTALIRFFLNYGT